RWARRRRPTRSCCSGTGCTSTPRSAATWPRRARARRRQGPGGSPPSSCCRSWTACSARRAAERAGPAVRCHRHGAPTVAARPAEPASLRPARVADPSAGPGSAGVEVLLQRLHGGVVGAEVPHAVVAVTDRGAQLARGLGADLAILDGTDLALQRLDVAGGERAVLAHAHPALERTGGRRTELPVHDERA